jgi:hypothetical protein
VAGISVAGGSVAGGASVVAGPQAARTIVAKTKTLSINHNLDLCFILSPLS